MESKPVFSTEKLTINEYVHEYFKNKIVPIIPNMKNYKFSVSGPISAGKSTLLQKLYMLCVEFGIKIAILPEYINSDIEIGPKFLARFINKEITNATFQNYILDVYKHTYNEIVKEDYNIMMMERVPDDSILIFANITNCNCPEDLNEQSLFALYNKMIQYDKECQFPSYIDNETKLIDFIGNIDDIIINVIDIIADDIEKGINKRIIGLSVNTDVCISRIKRRGRKEEKDYDTAYLSQIIYAYNEIFKIRKLNNEAKRGITDKKEIEKIDKKYNIRFTNIGKLVDNY